MMFKRMLIVIVALLMVFPAITSAKKITKLNVAPLMKVPKKGGISSADQLKKLVETYKDRIKEGFEKAGMPELYTPFMEQINTAEIKDIVIPKGQMILWMLFYSRPQKSVEVSKDVEWAGKKTVDAFTFPVKLECKIYEVVIPKVCGNVSLWDTKSGLASCDVQVSHSTRNVDEPVTIDVSGSKCAASYEITISLNGNAVDSKKLPADSTKWETSFKDPGRYTISAKAFNADGIPAEGECTAVIDVLKPYPPECNLKAEPMRIYAGQSVKLDASGSSDKDGKVVQADFTVTNKKDGQVVEQKAVNAQPFVWTKVFDKSGIYGASVKVTDDTNRVSTNDCSVGPIEVQKKLYMLVEAGPMVAKGTYSGYVFGRIGLSYLIVPEKVSFILSGGYAVKLTGKRFKNHFLANALLNYHMADFFIGAGLGYSSKVRDDWKAGLDIVGNIGYDIFKSFNKKGSIFGEIRVPVRKDLKFKEAHEFLLGFRYQF
jgi:hypothetical protein